MRPTVLSVLILHMWPQGLEEVSRTEIGKKIKEGVEEAAKSAMHSAESVSKGGEKLGKTSAFKAISQVRANTHFEMNGLKANIWPKL